MRNVLLQQFQAFQTQLGSPYTYAPSGGGHVSGRESRKRQGPQQDSDAEFKSRLEVARKQAFEIFISIDGEAKALDTTSSRKERQSRRKRFYVSIFILRAEQTLLYRWPQTCHGFWAPPGGPDDLPEPSASSDTSTITLRNSGKASSQSTLMSRTSQSPRGRRLSSSRCCKSWMAGSGRPPGGGTSCGPRLSVQPSVSSREQVAGAHGSCRDSERKHAFQHRHVRDADA